MTIAPSIRVEKIFISPGHNFSGHELAAPGQHPTVEVTEIQCVAGKGLQGDRYFNHKADYQGQATFISAEVFEEVCHKLGVTDKSPAVTRRNIVVRGVDLNSLIGQRFAIQGVVFEGHSECSPCRWMNRVIAPGAEQALLNRGGLRARIISDGVLRVDA